MPTFSWCYLPLVFMCFCMFHHVGFEPLFGNICVYVQIGEVAGGYHGWKPDLDFHGYKERV